MGGYIDYKYLRDRFKLPENIELEYGKLPCGCPKPYREPYESCILNKPMCMVIPPEGIHLDCPIHPGGHHLYGSSVKCESSFDFSSGNIRDNHFDRRW